MQALGGRVGLRGLLGVEHQLQHAAAIAQVDEDDAAVITTAVHPSGNAHVLPGGLGGAHRGVRAKACCTDHAPPPDSRATRSETGTST